MWSTIATRNYTSNVELITDAGTFRKRVAKPSFFRGNPITDCLTAVQCKVATLTLNRHIYVGFSVLELSSCHYNHMRGKYNYSCQVRLLFTDTDSLSYTVQTGDIYRDMAEDAANRYDFSEYAFHHLLYSATNRQELGLLKDELNSVHVHHFVGPSPKCYAFLCTGKLCNNVFQHTNPVEKKTAKGVKRSVKDAHLYFVQYLDAPNNFRTYLFRQNLIKSTSHTVRTVHMCKAGLTAYDTKRWLCDDTIHTRSS